MKTIPGGESACDPVTPPSRTLWTISIHSDAPLSVLQRGRRGDSKLHRNMQEREAERGGAIHNEVCHLLFVYETSMYLIVIHAPLRAHCGWLRSVCPAGRGGENGGCLFVCICLLFTSALGVWWELQWEAAGLCICLPVDWGDLSSGGGKRRRRLGQKPVYQQSYGSHDTNAEGRVCVGGGGGEGGN